MLDITIKYAWLMVNNQKETMLFIIENVTLIGYLHRFAFFRLLLPKRRDDTSTVVYFKLLPRDIIDVHY